MTQQEFNNMPLVLSPAHMKQITGLGDKGLETLRESNPQIVHGRTGRGKHRYDKREVAKLFKLTYV